MKRILIIARGDLARQVKPIKLAATLSAAGYEVIRLGFKVRPDDPGEARDEFGLIVRIQPPEGTFPPSGDGQKLPGSSTPARAIREQLKRALFRFQVGQALRERVIARRRTHAPRHFRAAVTRWNQALAAVGLELKPDLVISSQLDVLEAGHTVAQTAGVPLVYDVRDLATAAGWMYWSDPWFERYEARLIRDASLVTTVSPGLADYLQQRYRIRRPVVLYNSGTNCADAVESPSVPLKLLFQGYFSPLVGLMELVSAMPLVRDVAILTLQGEGVLEAELRRAVAQLGLEGVVRFEPFVPPLEAALAASAHDIGVCPWVPRTENLRRALPNKLFDYLGGGLAILCSDAPEIRRIVVANDCGVLFDAEQPSAFVGAVRMFAANLHRTRVMKNNALRSWEQYSWPKQERVLIEEVKRILPLHSTAAPGTGE